ncbi:MAG: hypothetical protein ACTHKU_14115 [Verrucomicrobiota bacterium]
MSWFASYRLRRWLTVAALLSAINPALAQMRSRQIVEPQALRLQIIESYTGVFFEGVHEKTDYGGKSGSVSYDRLFVAPLIGLNMSGSVYHPSLLTFTINGEAAPGYSHEKTTSGATSELNEYRVLGNYLVNGTLLGSKPYRTVLFLSQNYSYRDYDFFNRVEADILRYGATTGYREGPVPFTINVWRRHEDTFGLSDDSSLRETGLIFDANNDRDSGSSAFNYTFTDYNRQDFGAEAGGTDHSFGVNDTEFFGRRKQIQLNTTLGYSTRQYTESPSDDFNASLNLSIEHRPTLSSFYDASYYHSSSDSSVGSVDSDNLNGGVSLRHQLYESLSSTIRLQGLDFSSTGSFTDTNGVSTDSSSETTRFGGGLTEQYTKHLNPVARLMVLGSVLYEHTDQQNSGGEIIQIDEAHSFPGSGSTSPSDTFFLNLPFVDEASIVITDGQNTLPAYQEGIDYTVSRNGFLTLIQRTGTSTIPRDTVVLVDYRAESSPSGNYDTITSLLQVRVDFWNGLLGVYGRLNSVQNNGSSELVVQDINAVAFGADTIWRWLHAGAEYEIYDSTFSAYRTARTYQSLAFKPDDASTLNLDFIESYTQYLDADRDEQNYTFISRYRRRVTRHLGLNVEGGVSKRIGEGVDQTMAAFRPGVEFRMGEMFVKAGYDFEYGKFLNSEERFKHMLFIRARRSF